MLQHRVGIAAALRAWRDDDAAKRGVRIGEVSGETRAVTHLDVSREDIDTAVAAIAAITSSSRRAQ